MATDYAGAVRNGTMAAGRLLRQMDVRASIERQGGNIDVFETMFRLNLPLLLRPLKGLLGAFLREPIPGALVTTERPLSIQRFTAAHELGHFILNHEPSLDDEKFIGRSLKTTPVQGDFQETEADAFAVGFLMPHWLVGWHCARQGWHKDDLSKPLVVYQLALRLGVSYEATTRTLQRYNYLSVSQGRALRNIEPRSLKAEMLRDYRPDNYRGDVWLLTERDAQMQIDGSRHDLFVLRLNEHAGGGYLWNLDELRSSGFVVVRDGRDSIDTEGVGSPVIRHVTAKVEEAQRGQVSIDESRPWETDEPLTRLTLDYDLTGPEEEGYSRAERRHQLEAA